MGIILCFKARALVRFKVLRGNWVGLSRELNDRPVHMLQNESVLTSPTTTKNQRCIMHCCAKH